MEILLEIIKYTLPALIVFLTTYFILKQLLRNQQQIKLMSFKKETQQITLPLKLQAYERLTLFCERSALQNIILRIRSESMSASDLHLAILVAMQKEYEHNVAQQVYVSPELWEIINLAKNETLNIVNKVVRELPENATGLDLSRAIFEFEKTLPVNPLQKALLGIKKEASKYM
ncbi:MAG: hypothetical protein AAF502_23690 [Bacteroidota bacterium]